MGQELTIPSGKCGRVTKVIDGGAKIEFFDFATGGTRTFMADLVVNSAKKVSNNNNSASTRDKGVVPKSSALKQDPPAARGSSKLPAPAEPKLTKKPKSRTSLSANTDDDRPIDVEKARSELIKLRARIWRETGTGASADGILRRKMIDLFLEQRPSTVKQARGGDLGWYIERCDKNQCAYLEEICSIVSRVAG